MNDKKKKKEFVIPEADIVSFADDDIITLSGVGTLYWGGDDNKEKPFQEDMTMKKKLLLGLLPTLLILSSCQAAPKVAPKVDLHNIIEDTEAHDEVFGESKLVGDLRVRKTYDGEVEVPEEGETSILSLGIQTKINDKGTGDDSDDEISIRFVGAIKVVDENSDGDVDDADLALTTAAWTRTIFDDDGNVSVASAIKGCSKAYTSLAAPNDVEGDETPDNILTIEEFNAGKAGRAYTHFVVYTLLDIPLATYGNYYVVVDLETNTNSSMELATTIDQSTQFTFAPYINAHPLNNHYFAVKKTASGFETIDAEASAGSGNHAKFENMNLAKNEGFVIVHRVIKGLGSNADKFEVYGYDKVHLGDAGDNTFTRMGVSQFTKAKYGLMKYHLFLSSNGSTPNYIYTNCVKRYYLTPTSTWTDPEYENDTNYRFAVYYRVNGATDWYSMIYETGVYYADLTFPAPGNMDLLIFCKMWGDNPTNDWPTKRHQTGDLTWQPEKNQYTIASLDSSGESAGANWSVYGA